MDNIAVSCIVPIYNASEFLMICIDSLVTQTLRNIEIILIDDGSTDSSADICKRYAYDERVIYQYKENGGVSSARNMGLSIARGEYILFVDADDYIDYDLCEKAYVAAKKYDADICLWDFFRNQDTVTYTHEIKEGVYYKEELQKKIAPMSLAYLSVKGKGLEIVWANWLRLYRKALIEKNHIKFDERFQNGEDMLFTLETTLMSRVMYKFPEWRPYHYRVSQNSLTSGYIKGFWIKRVLLIERMFMILDERCRKDLYKQAWLRTFFWTILAIKNELKNYAGNNQEEVTEKIREIIEDPIHKKYLKKLPLEEMDDELQFFYQCIETKDTKKILDTYLREKKKDKRNHNKKKVKKWLKSHFVTIFHFFDRKSTFL